mmetsp:Transcript_34248/g.112876  ORF Transcript_34248/g.112876 Transcript_34248/m.112876 type:complete len:229 (-) Transcript_34248:61-747(-)
MSLPGRKHHAADRAQRDVEAVRRAVQVDVHPVTAHRRLPLRRREGGAGVLGLDDQVAAREGPHRAEEEGPLATEAGEHVEAGVEVVELVRPECSVHELSLLAFPPRLGHDVHLGDEGAVHRQRALVQLEGGVLGLDVDRKARSRVEAIQQPVAAAKVSASTVCEGEVGVLDGVRDSKPGIARRQLGAPSLVAGLLKRDDGILRRVLRSIGRVEPPLQLQNLGGQLATV